MTHKIANKMPTGIDTKAGTFSPDVDAGKHAPTMPKIKPIIESHPKTKNEIASNTNAIIPKINDDLFCSIFFTP